MTDVTRTDVTRDTAFAARRLAAALLVAAVGLVPVAAQAQTPAEPAPAAGSTPVGAFGGFGGGGKGPIQIESNELEVQDKKGVAIFTGNVIAKQGDSVLQAQKLVVYYAQPDAGNKDGTAAKKPSAPAAAEGQQQQQIERLEATGRVLLSEKDQTATGSAATYDAKSQTMVMTGDVVLTQGGNVVRGNKLVVHLDTGEARVFANKRVQMLLVPNEAPTAPGSQPAAAPAKK